MSWISVPSSRREALRAKKSSIGRRRRVRGWFQTPNPFKRTS
jgi:hypothetical protein